MLSLYMRTRLLLRLATCLVVFFSVIPLILFYSKPTYADEPSSIRVLVTDEDPDEIRTVDFQEYLQDVLPNEWFPSWDAESLRAGAVAVRTFSWYHTLHPLSPNYDLSDYTQRYIHGSDEPATNQAVENTSGIHVTYNSQVVWARHASEHSDPTLSYPGYSPPLMSVQDPVCVGSDGHPLPRNGHGHGVCQWGSQRWARGEDPSPSDSLHPRWPTYQYILVHYYTGVHIRDANGTILTPSYRWNPLGITWGPPNNRPPIMYHGGSYPVTIQVQNTSIYDWPLNGQSWALSYHWAKSGFGEMDSGNRAWTTVDVPKGDPPYTFSLTINDIPDWRPGAYTLKFDMVLLTYGGYQWFSRTYGWPTYDVSICVDGPCKVFIPVVLKNYGG